MAKNKPKTRLSDLDLSMVSLVPAGDDPMAKAVLFKSAEHKNTGNNNEAHTLHDQHDKENNPVAKNEDSTVISKDDLDPEVVAYIEALEDEVTEQEATIKSLQAPVAKTEEDDGEGDPAGDEADEDDDVVKSAIAKAAAAGDTATASLIAKMAADQADALQRVAKAEQVANEERSERLRRDFVAKAATELPAIQGSADEKGALLKRLHDLDPAVATQVETVLKAASAQLESSALFSELGAGGAGVTLSASVEAAAKALQKSDPDLTPEQAVAKAMDQNPALYEQSLQG